MNRTALLQETSTWMDTVDLALCLFIYEVCNDYQFEYLAGSDFVNFLNLKPTSQPVTVCPKENLRVCYMVFSVSQTIRPRERGRLWAEEFLKRCGISKSYYDKHRSDVCGKGATEKNQNYRKAIDKATGKITVTYWIAAPEINKITAENAVQGVTICSNSSPSAGRSPKRKSAKK